MPRFNVSRDAGYTTEQIMAIAADVGSYHRFLPLVVGSRMFDQKKNSDGTREFKGEIHIRYKKLKVDQKFISQVVVDEKNKTIVSRAGEGMFEHLVSTWSFADLPEGGCRITYDVDYKAKSRAVGFLISGMFDLAARKLLNAFEARARELYGPPKLSRSA
ncbi:type II toxin-antitoxin system RatA family toxin [soil metagenome]